MDMTLWNLLFCVLIYAGNNVEAKVAHIVGPGTTDAQPDKYPFLVYIQKKNEFAVPRFIGSGILFRPSVVLALAYTFVDKLPEDIEVVLGVYNRSDETAPSREVIGVAEIVIIPGFTKNSAKDVSLMRLVSSPVGLPSSRIKTLGMRNIAMTAEEDEVSWSNTTTCVSPGFGVIKRTEFEVIYPTIRQEYNVTVVEPMNNQITGNDLWLVSQNADMTSACVGDGGNPLLCHDNNGKYKVYGQGFASSALCDEGIVGWTRLSSYYDWIKRASRKLQLKTNSA